MDGENHSLVAVAKPSKARRQSLAAAQSEQLCKNGEGETRAVPNQKRGREGRDGRLPEAPTCRSDAAAAAKTAPICATQPAAALYSRLRKFDHHMDSSVP